MGDFEQVKKSKKTNVLPFAQGAEFFFNAGTRHAVNGDFETALKYMNRAIELDAYNPDYLFNKACILVEMRKTKESTGLLNQIIWKIDPTYAECYFGLGCNYLESGDYAKALMNFEKFISMENLRDEYDDDADEFLMDMQNEYEQWDEAFNYSILELMKQKKRRATNARKLMLDGSLLLLEGKYPEAILKLEKSIIACPEVPDARIRVSMAYFFCGDIKMATILANSVLKMQRGNYMGLLCLALYYHVGGQESRVEQVLSELEQVIGMRQQRLDHEDWKLYVTMLKSADPGDPFRNRLSQVVSLFGNRGKLQKRDT